jgi:hypothetical protein
MGAPQAADLPGQQPSPHLSGGGVFNASPRVTISDCLPCVNSPTVLETHQ